MMIGIYLRDNAREESYAVDEGVSTRPEPSAAPQATVRITRRSVSASLPRRCLTVGGAS